ncbi:hypothetical protein QF206_06010 [Klugiella sp. YN-L-19]|uniref:DUF421 domain-containing protein n=1 Tax=Ruicaihuangia caeni TaxID=3042517 RepID=A0AAW6T8Y5_9MICO|nr:hypothetical protein [Klugiella sp. YN-L-19]MDI2098515.1 hypothetical protein [Klugiella sp. YN-L-19]
MDWASIFVPSIPVLESVVRGSLVVIGLTILLRITGQRESGSLALTDLLVIVLIAQAIGQGLAPESTSITDGFISVLTILAWSIASMRWHTGSLGSGACSNRASNRSSRTARRTSTRCVASSSAVQSWTLSFGCKALKTSSTCAWPTWSRTA